MSTFRLLLSSVRGTSATTLRRISRCAHHSVINLSTSCTHAYGVYAISGITSVYLYSLSPAFAQTSQVPEDEGVFFDPTTEKWSSMVMMDGQLKKLKSRDSKEQAERDYEYVVSRLTGTTITESQDAVGRSDEAPPGAVQSKKEEDARLESIKIMNLIHVDPSKMSREKKLSFLSQISKVVADTDVAVLWRLARGLHNLTDEFFESREEQVELLELARQYAEQALSHSPDHLQAQTWLKLSSIRLLETKISILVTESKKYGVTAERKAKIAAEKAQMETERQALRAFLNMSKEGTKNYN